MFALNQSVVYPGYGVARVNNIIERSVGAHVEHFYELKFLHKEMTILVPVDTLSSVGLRPLSHSVCVDMVFKLLADSLLVGVCAEGVVVNWNKRNKKYQALLRSGDLVEISKIYRDLQHLARTKDLSFGERALLAQTEILLAEEIAMISHALPEHIIAQMRSLCGCRSSASGKQSESLL